ncbi:MAG: PilZ domain-containing protein [Planctomycetota bacterium]|nr:PilZ domain-containing protein [Planctomycetota bacterium]
MPSAHTGEQLVSVVTDLTDLIDTEFQHMWANPTDELQIVDPIDPTDDDSNDDDRRRFPRRDSGCIVKVCRSGQTVPLNRVTWKWRLHASRLKGSLSDISLNGISFTIDEQLTTGEFVLLQIKNQRLDASIECAARVIRTIHRPDGWQAVCQFTNPLNLDALHRIARHVRHGEFV